MKIACHIICLLCLLQLSSLANAQGNKEIAQEKAELAIELMDNKQYDQSIKLLQEAIKLDPKRPIYSYELGYAYFLKGDRKKAISIFEDLVKLPEAGDQYFQMLGNFTSIDGNPKKAHKIYDSGLKKFPNSGRLYLEKGNLLLHEKKYNEALVLYEKGIEVDPTYPSNYFRAAHLFLNSDEEVWGMIYGEIFMNLERNSARTAEMSKMLYDTYKREIKFTSDSSFSVSFSKNATISVDQLKNPEKFRMPFGVGVYEPTLMLSIVEEKEINLASLSRIRERFVKGYNQNKNASRYPNALFTYLQEVANQGHLEAYSYWLLLKGNEEEFVAWKGANEEKWAAFLNWYPNNGLRLSQDNKFYRAQY